MDCVDTQTLIWRIGGLNRVTRGQEEMVARSIKYFDHAQREKLDIMVPAPVLAEYWAGATSQERHEKEIFELSTFIAPFDAYAAIIAGEMFRDVKRIDDLSNRFRIDFDCIKIDIMIASIAISNEKATRLITHDNDLYIELVQGRIEVAMLPELKPTGGQRNFLED